MIDPLPVMPVAKRASAAAKFLPGGKRGYVLFGLVLALAGSGWWYRWPSEIAAVTSAAGEEEQVTQSGSWGELLCRTVNLEQPAEYVAFDKPDWNGPRWHFGTRSAVQVEQALLQAGADRAWVSRALASVQPGTGGKFVLKPDDETVLALTEEVRARVYLLLADEPLNRGQAAPLYLAQSEIGRFFRGKFPEAKGLEEWARRLAYRRNGYLYFSDMEVLARLAGLNDAERTRLRLAVSAAPVVMARLKVGVESDPDSLVNYWGASMPGVFVKDVRPLFDAQRQLAEGGSVSILYVLPPLARSNLYTTPITPQKGDALPDCHFTALNFFNHTPDPRLSDQAYASRYLADNYYEIGAPGRPGDLVILVNPQHQIVHSATYLAGDVVYTKNGINLGQPWVLMHLDDMVGIYSIKEPLRVAYMRRRTT